VKIVQNLFLVFRVFFLFFEKRDAVTSGYKAAIGHSRLDYSGVQLPVLLPVPLDALQLPINDNDD
jgi:hypothetical protein